MGWSLMVALINVCTRIYRVLFVPTRNFEIRNPYVFWKMFPFAKLVLSAKHLFGHSHHGYQFFVFELFHLE